MPLMGVNILMMREKINIQRATPTHIITAEFPPPPSFTVSSVRIIYLIFLNKNIILKQLCINNLTYIVWQNQAIFITFPNNIYLSNIYTKRVNII